MTLASVTAGALVSRGSIAVRVYILMASGHRKSVVSSEEPGPLRRARIDWRGHLVALGDPGMEVLTTASIGMRDLQRELGTQFLSL